MNRKAIITYLTLYYSLLGVIIGVWGFQNWSASEPLGNFVVKGASTSVQAADTESNSSSKDFSPYPVVNTSQLPAIQAKQYVLYNPESGKVLVRSKTLDPVPIASTTKLMTAYLASELLTFSDVITISPEAAKQPAESSMMGLHAKEKISIENLLLGAMLVSGNDAAYAIGEYAGGKLLNNPAATSTEKIERFVQEMNTKAKQLHMQNTDYKDPVGINDEGRSTALDLAKLTSKINEVASLTKIMNTPTATVYDQSKYYRYDLRNSNRLVAEYQYAGVMGGKTGFTYEAGHCLVGSAKRGDISLIAVILHTNQDTKEASALETRKLLDFGFTTAVQWY